MQGQPGKLNNAASKLITKNLQGYRSVLECLPSIHQTLGAITKEEGRKADRQEGKKAGRQEGK